MASGLPKILKGSPLHDLRMDGLGGRSFNDILTGGTSATFEESKVVENAGEKSERISCLNCFKVVARDSGFV